MRRTVLAAAILSISVAACGGSMSETEYVEGLNDLVSSASPGFEASNAIYGQAADPTVADLVARLEREIAIEYDVRERFEALDPPASITDVHGIMVDTLGRIIGVTEALVDVSADVGSLEEAEQTREFSDYQSVNAESDGMCPEVQAKFDLLSNRAVIDDPWIADLRLTVTAFLDCT
jgi:hypothetical protein